MTWLDWLTDVMGGDPVYLATATTGLSDEDELIAVSAWKQSGSETLIMRKISNDRLLPALPYHNISAEDIVRYGQEDDQVKARIQELCSHGIVSYNPAFQLHFLEPYVEGLEIVDITMLVKAAESMQAIPPDALGSLATMVNCIARDLRIGRMPFLKALQRRELSLDESKTLLPVERFSKGLRQFAQLLGNYDLITQ